MAWPARHRPWIRRFVAWFCALSLLQPAVAAVLPALLASSGPGWDSVCSAQTAASTPAAPGTPGDAPSSTHGGPHCALCAPQVPLLDSLGSSRLDVPTPPQSLVLAVERPAAQAPASPWRRPASRAPPARFATC